METNRRSFVKALSWRVIATLITGGIVYLMTGKGEFAAAVGLVDTSLKFAVYFGHERVWNRIRYGREKQEPEYYI